MIKVKDLEGYDTELPQKNMTLYGMAIGRSVEDMTDAGFASKITFSEFRFNSEPSEDEEYYEDGLFELNDDGTIQVPFVIKYHGENVFKLEERASKIAMNSYQEQVANMEFDA